MWNALIRAIYNKFAPYDNSPNVPGLGDLLNTCLENRLVVVRGTYDFDVQGGAEGAINLLDADGEPIEIPENAVISNVYIDGRVVPDSGGAATIALGVVGTPDAFLSASAFDGGDFDAGVRDLAPGLMKSGGGNLIATIADEDLTAGVFDIFVVYTQGLATP